MNGIIIAEFFGGPLDGFTEKISENVREFRYPYSMWFRVVTEYNIAEPGGFLIAVYCRDKDTSIFNYVKEFREEHYGSSYLQSSDMQK